MSTVIDFAEFKLGRLDPESWGRRMMRAREDVALLTVRQVEDKTGGYVSRSALSRIEALTEPPAKIADRRRALVAVLLYRVDPAEFGLGPEDVPPLIDINAVVQANVQSLCFSGGQLVNAGDELELVA
jgi:hypothetical protein